MNQERVAASVIRGRKGTRFAAVTAYDAPFAECVEAAGIDIILVGDSVGTILFRNSSTDCVTMFEMSRHTLAVARATHRAHIIADMPPGSYDESDSEAVYNAQELAKSGATSVKLEGGVLIASRIEAIVQSGIGVVGHIDGARNGESKSLHEARTVQDAGAFALVLKNFDEKLADTITTMLSIPTIGIASGAYCDGQIAILHDILGMVPDAPRGGIRFLDLATLATSALHDYATAVRLGVFPRSVF